MSERIDTKAILEKWAYRDNENPEQNIRRDEALHETRVALEQERSDADALRTYIKGNEEFILQAKLIQQEERIRLLEQERADAEGLRERYRLLEDGVNDSDAPCLPECDSYSHAEDCPNMSTAKELETLGNIISALRERIRLLEQAGDNVARWAVEYAKAGPSHLAFVDARAWNALMLPDSPAAASGSDEASPEGRKC